VLEGWGVASDGGLTVALDLELTPELRREGVARELVRLVQDARRAADLDVGDRIVLGVATSGPVLEALREHAATIARETLAVELRETADEDAPTTEIASVPVRVQISRV
jgi:isoleucyl-tRNA synthetase